MKSKQRILVVGGVAGGASCAARARRNCESADIVIFERGPHVSFANCGLPYYVGEVIANENDLLVATPQRFQDQLNVDVRTLHEVVGIDRDKQDIEVVELATGKHHREHYDALVLSPGASPIRPSWPGVDLPGIFTLRNIPDSNKIKAWIDEKQARRAVVVGGGFIGLEMAENLHRRGLQVILIEASDQVFAPFDREMAFFVDQHLRKAGIELRLQEAVKSFSVVDGQLSVETQAGTYATDFVVIGIGVKPEVGLAKAANLSLGPRGGIQVDDHMRTNDPHIWAVGDAVEKSDAVTGAVSLLALAGPANRQGRVAADNICGRDVAFRGTQATAVCGILGLTAAATGANEKSLLQSGRPYDKVYLHPADHARYYPGAETMHLKILFDPENGKILGAQAAGMAGVEKRIDVIAMALQLGGTVYDLEESELSYAPQYGSAKDAINFAGMAAANQIRGDAHIAHWDRLPESSLLLDVRDRGEFDAGHVPGAIHIPLQQLRLRIGEIANQKAVYLYCQVGLRGHLASRLLRQNDIEAYNLSGGYLTYLAQVENPALRTV